MLIGTIKRRCHYNQLYISSHIARPPTKLVFVSIPISKFLQFISPYVANNIPTLESSTNTQIIFLVELLSLLPLQLVKYSQRWTYRLLGRNSTSLTQ